MTKESDRLLKLVDDMGKPAAKPAPRPRGKSAAIDVNPPKGEKGDFFKVTVTLPPEVLGLLRDESSRRRLNKEKNYEVSTIIREAVVEMLGKSR